MDFFCTSEIIQPRSWSKLHADGPESLQSGETEKWWAGRLMNGMVGGGEKGWNGWLKKLDEAREEGGCILVFQNSEGDRVIGVHIKP